MALLLPVFALVFTPLALLGANRLQPGFRSNWLVAAGGALLASLALVVLRFRLPLSTEFAGWSLGPEFPFPYILSLTEITWPLALALAVLLLIGLFAEARKDPTASWLTWTPSLLLGAAAILVVISGDLLAFAFSFFLLDLLTLALHLSSTPDEEVRRQAIMRFAVYLIGVVCTLGVWGLSFNWPWLSNGLLWLPAAIRIGLFTPRFFQPSSELPRSEVDLMVRFASPVSALALLSLWKPIAQEGSITIWIFLALGGIVVLFLHSPRRWLPPRLAASRNRLFATPCPIPFGVNLFRPIQWLLDLVAGLLESEAGVLWAMLIVALLLSLAAQFGSAG